MCDTRRSARAGPPRPAAPPTRTSPGREGEKGAPGGARGGKVRRDSAAGSGSRAGAGLRGRPGGRRDGDPRRDAEARRRHAGTAAGRRPGTAARGSRAGRGMTRSSSPTGTRSWTRCSAPVTLTRAWYHCAACGHGFAPRDAELGVAGTSMSPGLTAMNDRAAAAGPFAKAAGLLQDLAGIRLTAKRVERAAEASGAAQGRRPGPRRGLRPPAHDPRRRRGLDLLSRHRDSRSYSGDAVIPGAHVVTLRSMPIGPSMAG